MIFNSGTLNLTHICFKITIQRSGNDRYKMFIKCLIQSKLIYVNIHILNLSTEVIISIIFLLFPLVVKSF